MVKVSKRAKFFLFTLLAGLIVTIAPETAQAAPPPPPGGPDIGGVLDNLRTSIRRVPNILTSISFIAGLMLAVWGVLRLKAHVDNPNQFPISDGIKRLIAGGAFLGLPVTTNVIKGSIFGTDTGEIADSAWGVVAPVGPPVALDEVAVTFITTMALPMKYLLISFSYISGLALILVGISRLVKTAQEGPRGPTGMGTLITFISGMALMSLGQSMGTFTTSLFGDGQMKNFTVLNASVAGALTAPEQQQLINVIGSVLMFVSLVGFIAFIRGLFLLKAVADGNQQHSLTQALTFLLGGALAVNLGDVVNMFQDTLGYAGLGFTFV